MPRIIKDPDEWSSIAEPMQAELLAATAEDRQPYTSAPAPTKPETQIVGPDPADRTHAYKPNPLVIPPPNYVGAEDERSRK